VGAYPAFGEPGELPRRPFGRRIIFPIIVHGGWWKIGVTLLENS